MRISRSSLRRTLICLGIGILAAMVFVVVRVSQRHRSIRNLTPGAAYLEAQKLFTSGNATGAEDYLEHARSQGGIAAWANVLDAEIAVRNRDFDRAVSLLREIPSSSAASLDAAIGLLKIAVRAPSTGYTGTVPTSMDPEAWSTLEQSARNTLRTDLLQELILTHGEFARIKGDFAGAIGFWQAVRDEFPGSPAAKRAHAFLEALRKEQPASFSTAPAQLLGEARHLLEERELTAALELTQTARRETVPSSEAYFQTLLLEEEVVRTSGRKQEADQILEKIAAEGSIGTGDAALLRIIKQLWNKDDNKATLDAIARFHKKFESSPLIGDVEVIESRCLIDLGRLADALHPANDSIGRISEPIARLRAMRSLGWLHRRLKNGKQALSTFQRGYAFGKAAVEAQAEQIRELYSASTQSGPARRRIEELRARYRDMLDEALHHQYWLAITLREIGATVPANSLAGLPKAEELLQGILSIAPNTYYALRAAEALGKEPFVQFAPSSPDDQRCIEHPAGFELILQALLPARELAQREIDFHFRNAGDPKQLAAFLKGLDGSRPLLENEFHRALAMVSLSQRFGTMSRGTGLAESLWKRPKQLKPLSEGAESCLPVLNDLAFPQPYFVTYLQESTTSRVPVTLLLAISRTESFFAESAQSPKNAQGLMQLLPETAKDEGLLDSESLFDPAVNIRLGAKHLGKLLDQYRQVEVAAAAYNAGTTSVNRWLAREPLTTPDAWVESITYPETRDYVKKVTLARAMYMRLIGNR